MQIEKRYNSSYIKIFIRINLNVSRDIFAVKSNSTNTAIKFYNPICERVEKLNYFQPNYSNILTTEEKINNNIIN